MLGVILMVFFLVSNNKEGTSSGAVLAENFNDRPCCFDPPPFFLVTLFLGQKTFALVPYDLTMREESGCRNARLNRPLQSGLY